MNDIPNCQFEYEKKTHQHLRLLWTDDLRGSVEWVVALCCAHQQASWARAIVNYTETEQPAATWLRVAAQITTKNGSRNHLRTSSISIVFTAIDLVYA